MGMFFSSLHFRRRPSLSRERVAEAVCAAWEQQGYRRTDSPGEATLTLDLLGSDDSAWFSLQSEDLDFSDFKSIRELAAPLSRKLKTAVLAISCADSDYLFLNWIDEAAGLDAWANVGRCPGRVPRRTGFSAWKKIVPNLAAFQQAIKADYLFAEESLHALATILDLPEAQTLPSPEPDPLAMRLYFAFPNAPASQGHPRLEITLYNRALCQPGKSTHVTALNRGDASKGLAVVFTGPWVENDEIHITDVQLESRMDRSPRSIQPLTLEKVRDEKGNLVLMAKVPQFPLPVPRKMLSTMKQLKEDFARSFLVRFTPEGESRKYLDINVFFVPLEELAGQCGWCVWAGYPSKEAYIRSYNEGWSKHPEAHVQLLNPEDYDL